MSELEKLREEAYLHYLKLDSMVKRESEPVKKKSRRVNAKILERSAKILSRAKSA